MQSVKLEGQRSPQSSAAEDDLSPAKVSQILEQNTKFLVAKIKEFQEKVTALESEIAGMKNRMSYSRPAPESAPQRGSEAAPSSQSASQQSAPNHPRSGAYNDKDVSIEKFFYMGNKK